MAQNILQLYRPPPGVHFVPKDEELLEHYLKPKNLGHQCPLHDNMSCRQCLLDRMIREFDIYKCPPHELPCDFPYGKHNEQYFYVTRDLSKSRAVRRVGDGCGYWRSTGCSERIRQGSVIGSKMKLVFCIGRGSEREKTDWMMHEYILDGMGTTRVERTTKRNGFVLCKIYKKAPSKETEEGRNQMTRKQTGNVETEVGGNQMTRMPDGDAFPDFSLRRMEESPSVLMDDDDDDGFPDFSPRRIEECMSFLLGDGQTDA